MAASNPTTKQEVYKCPRCGIELSISSGLSNEDYIQCLTCGKNFKNPLKYPDNKTTFWTTQRILCTIGIVIILYFAFGGGCDNKSTQSATSYYVNEDTYAATSKSAWDAVGRYSLANDVAAVQGLVMNGDVIPLKEGTEVYIEKAGGLGYRVVRRKGSTQQLWVHSEDITRK